MDASPTLSRRIGKTLWRGYAYCDSDEYIRADFLRRYGVLPGEIVRRPGVSTVLALVPESVPDNLTYPENAILGG